MPKHPKPILITMLCAIMLGLPSVLAACTIVTTDRIPDAGDDATQQQIAEPSLEPSLSAPITKPWMEAYANIISEAPIWEAERGYFGYFTLADVNNDGIPELFFLEVYRIPYIKCGYCFKDGQAVEMILPKSLPMGLEMYRDSQTNELFWLAGGTEYSNVGAPFGDSGYQKHHQWWSVDYSDLSAIKKELYLAWVARKVWYDPPAGEIVDKGFRYWIYEYEQTLPRFQPEGAEIVALLEYSEDKRKNPSIRSKYYSGNTSRCPANKRYIKHRRGYP